MSAGRVVSLVPSVTETLMSWGVVPVGVTRFCEQPALLAVGGTKDPDIAAIVALRPDLVVTNDEENRREDADALQAAGLAVHAVRVRSVDDVAALAALAAAVGVGPPAVSLPAPVAPAVVAFVPIWRNPWMTLNAETYGSSLLTHVGVGNSFGAAAERYPQVTLEEATARRPDVVVAPSEPYPFRERHVVELMAVAPVVLVDGQDLFWWGTRTAAAVRRLRVQLRSVEPRD